MEQRLGNTWRMTVNEKKFIEKSLLSNIRVDGRALLDYRRLVVEFGREDGSSDVQLGQTHVMGFVTSQLVQPYRDRPNEGSLSIYTEFSPMADPLFEAGRSTESAVELGRVIDRGLRESRAVDMESLCVVTGKLVWSIRVDLHVLDNGGNLADAANIAALAALLTFRRSECTLGGEDGQEVTIHPPEKFVAEKENKLSKRLKVHKVKEPLPLLIQHLPIAVTFGFFDNGEIMIIDPTHYEEAVMEGRLTATLNTNGDVCAIQKAGGVGVIDNNIIACLRFASVKAADITATIRNAVESYNTERALRKIKHHSSSTGLDVDEPCTILDNRIESLNLKGVNDSTSVQHMEQSTTSPSLQGETQSFHRKRDGYSMSFRLSSWSPYSKGVDFDALKASLASRGGVRPPTKVVGERHEQHTRFKSEEHLDDVKPNPLQKELVLQNEVTKKVKKTLKDAVKSKHLKKKKVSST